MLPTCLLKPAIPSSQILVGGENVYCTEVESVLHAHPLVASAAAFGVANAVLGELVAVAVVMRLPSAGEQPGQHPPASAALAPQGSVHGGSGGHMPGTAVVQLALAGGPEDVLRIERELLEWCRVRLAHFKLPSKVN